ncbi:serine hydrolase [Clostridium thermosuccinogenes]|uniref:Serine hydrolase n=2 Tax=Clostridium thermosuccinogenes TaxID=84032 RepID=A0A2K2EZH0_9CLOT|nr:serine hydrolase [Pseudoclostridium thermosuccinogenes]PNT91762.1 serine hydrolase [Pseudoclostridium thermosuccinogenes]PNT91933.1 serine hydrolase [Pseudoclostridium thermosuccinogenes]PNT92119.1 serine hydrolase [Pseudoclostridium thermosuccinogenes]
MISMELYEYVKETYPNICQISASRDGEVFCRETWNGYSFANKVHAASVTKSIIGLLIGIAIEKRLIESENAKVLDFFSNYSIKRGERTIQEITLHHLLTMTAPYKFKSEPWTKVCTSENWTKEVLDLLGGRKGLTGDFKYSTLGIQILSAIITKVSQMPTIEFANKYLFEPLGIERRQSISVHSKEEHIEFVTSKSPKKAVWYCDSSGIASAGFGLCLSADEMLKIGQMCLDKGIYGYKRVVSAEWIERMLSPKVSCGEKFGYMKYGYLWWIVDEEKQIFSAIGDGGNIIYINGAKNIVVSITSTFKPLVFDRIEFIQKHIEPLAGVQ